MPEKRNWIDVLLFILALPLLIVRGVRLLTRDLRRIETVRRGIVICASGHASPTNRLSKCAICGAVKPTSLLYCPICHTTYDAVACESCGETVLL